MARFVLAGSPVAHSRSPRMFEAAFRALGLEHTYEARDVDGAGLVDLVAALRRGDLAGMNVTVPHKVAALQLADASQPSAAAAGAANVLACDDAHRVVADNTDVDALAVELGRLGARASGRAIVLGAGGGARGAVLTLSRIGFESITVRARSVEKASALAMLGLGVTIEGLEPGNDADVTVVVQATSAGMRGADAGAGVAGAVAWENLPRSAVAYDLVYTPAVTPFVAAARSAGLHAESGMGMLIEQGALAFERWTGLLAPRDVMRDAAR